MTRRGQSAAAPSLLAAGHVCKIIEIALVDHRGLSSRSADV